MLVVNLVAPFLAFRKDPRLHTIALSRQYVPVIGEGGREVGKKAAYFGTMQIGAPEPQRFTMLFDTGSGHVILPSTKCTDEACLAHRRYDRSKSSSAVDIDSAGRAFDGADEERDALEIRFGTGQVAGELVEEEVCLAEGAEGRSDCARLRVVLATEMTRDPFASFDFDGVMGLGLDALPVDPAFSFVGRLAAEKRLEQSMFSFYLAPATAASDAGGELTFGGYNKDHAAGSFQWAPLVKPELGYWQVQILALRVANETLDLCTDGSCTAILDSGTSLLGVPKSGASILNRKLARLASPDASDCLQELGASLSFDLGGFEVQLDAKDYSRPAPVAMQDKNGNAMQVCRAQMMPVDLGDGSKTFLLGEPVLRKYYTAYDWGERRVGFAQARHEEFV